jgi:hypothetical protein
MSEIYEHHHDPNYYARKMDERFQVLADRWRWHHRAMRGYVTPDSPEAIRVQIRKCEAKLSARLAAANANTNPLPSEQKPAAAACSR